MNNLIRFIEMLDIGLDAGCRIDAKRHYLDA
jgi:hypothetical protein